MNQQAQLLIIPKGLINPEETTIIEIPNEFSSESKMLATTFQGKCKRYTQKVSISSANMMVPDLEKVKTSYERHFFTPRICRRPADQGDIGLESLQFNVGDYDTLESDSLGYDTVDSGTMKSDSNTYSDVKSGFRMKRFANRHGLESRPGFENVREPDSSVTKLDTDAYTDEDIEEIDYKNYLRQCQNSRNCPYFVRVSPKNYQYVNPSYQETSQSTDSDAYYIKPSTCIYKESRKIITPAGTTESEATTIETIVKPQVTNLQQVPRQEVSPEVMNTDKPGFYQKGRVSGIPRPPNAEHYQRMIYKNQPYNSMPKQTKITYQNKQEFGSISPNKISQSYRNPTEEQNNVPYTNTLPRQNTGPFQHSRFYPLDGTTFIRKDIYETSTSELSSFSEVSTRPESSLINNSHLKRGSPLIPGSCKISLNQTFGTNDSHQVHNSRGTNGGNVRHQTNISLDDPEPLRPPNVHLKIESQKNGNQTLQITKNPCVTTDAHLGGDSLSTKEIIKNTYQTIGLQPVRDSRLPERFCQPIKSNYTRNPDLKSNEVLPSNEKSSRFQKSILNKASSVTQKSPLTRPTPIQKSFPKENSSQILKSIPINKSCPTQKPIQKSQQKLLFASSESPISSKLHPTLPTNKSTHDKTRLGQDPFQNPNLYRPRSHPSGTCSLSSNAPRLYPPVPQLFELDALDLSATPSSISHSPSNSHLDPHTLQNSHRISFASSETRICPEQQSSPTFHLPSSPCLTSNSYSVYSQECGCTESVLSSSTYVPSSRNDMAMNSRRRHKYYTGRMKEQVSKELMEIEAEERAMLEIDLMTYQNARRKLLIDTTNCTVFERQKNGDKIGISGSQCIDL